MTLADCIPVISGWQTSENLLTWECRIGKHAIGEGEVFAYRVIVGQVYTFMSWRGTCREVVA